MKSTQVFGVLIAATALAACGGEDAASEPAATTEAPAADMEMAAAEPAAAPAEAEAPAPEPEPAPEPAPDPEMAEAEQEPAPAEPEMAAAEPESDAGGPFMVAGLVGNADAGRRIYTRCQTCHVLDEGVNRVGPSLYGIIGRTAGTVEGFRYSDANASSGVVWTNEVMFEYLENPRAFIPGTIMAFPGLRNPQDRADVIAYIRENGGVAE